MEGAATTGGDARVGALHQALVDGLKRAGAIRSAPVEAAFRAVPRHLFLPGVPPEQVYRDDAIPTKRRGDESISSSSQPTVMAGMLEQLGLAPGQRVLEIGAGTGYNAALIARIVGERGRVVAVDYDEDIVAGARAGLAAAGLGRVEVIRGDGAEGHAAGAPYDRIVLTVGAGEIAPAWIAQLAAGAGCCCRWSSRSGRSWWRSSAPTAAWRASRRAAGWSSCPCGGARRVGDERLVRPGGAVEPGDGRSGRGRSGGAGGDARGPARDEPAPVALTPRELLGSGLATWLELRTDRFCSLFALGAAADDAPFPDLGGVAGQFRATIGLRDGASLALLARPPIGRRRLPAGTATARRSRSPSALTARTAHWRGSSSNSSPPGTPPGGRARGGCGSGPTRAGRSRRRRRGRRPSASA